MNPARFELLVLSKNSAPMEPPTITKTKYNPILTDLDLDFQSNSRNFSSTPRFSNLQDNLFISFTMIKSNICRLNYMRSDVSE